ncbi:hypothetical protein GCM10010464_75500 [Pseudonocardia yunnanensis]
MTVPRDEPHVTSDAEAIKEWQFNRKACIAKAGDYSGLKPDGSRVLRVVVWGFPNKGCPQVSCGRTVPSDCANFPGKRRLSQ